MDTKVINMIAIVLLIIGGLNWGLVGLLNLNVVGYLPAILAKIVYILVGIAALYEIYLLTKK